MIHLASLNGNTRLVRCLVHSGCPINIRDGIGQTALTLALHMGHTITAKFIVESGASVRDSLFPNTVPPLEIEKIKEDTIMVNLIENKIREEENIIKHVGSFFHGHDDQTDQMETKDSDGNYARALNINVGDQKNTVLIQGCSNRCPHVYGCHTPGGGDFHNRGYVNECIARIEEPGGFWHVAEKVLKRPTVNPTSFKMKFKDNNYNNNEEALLDYDDGLAISMVKAFKKSSYFPTSSELDTCLEETSSHNKILLDRIQKWIIENEKSDQVFRYHSEAVNILMPLTRWYEESVRYGNGMALKACG